MCEAIENELYTITARCSRRVFSDFAPCRLVNIFKYFRKIVIPFFL